VKGKIEGGTMAFNDLESRLQEISNKISGLRGYL
jgi:hypothetical protein